MAPSTALCPHADGLDKGRVGAGNIGIHGQKERRS